MFSQEQEERDYNPQSELQNAYDQSQMEFTDDKGEVNRLRHMGRWVVVEESTAYCPRTDAILGCRELLIGDFATVDEAQECLDKQGKPECDEWLLVLPPIDPNPPTPALTRNDIPF